MTKEFDILNAEFIGYGNPKGKYWFGGIEGAAAFDTYGKVRSCKELKGERYFPDEPGVTAKVRKDMGSKYTKIYGAMAKIVLMHREGKQEVSVEEVNKFVNDELFMEASDNFQINLYPLGKPRVNSWKEEYSAWFGLKNKNEYLKKVNEERFPKIKDFVMEFNLPGRLIVCFGTSFINDYKEAFAAELLVQSGKSSKIYYDRNRRLLVVPFPAYGHLTNQGIKDTVQIMREFGN